MIEDLALAFEDDSLWTEAQKLSQTLNLPIDSASRNQLFLSHERLSLRLDKFSPLYADFSRKAWQKRREEGKGQGIIKACKPALGMSILDATAGWGRDSSILASFGAKVRMIERNPIVASLLEDALKRQSEEDKVFLNLELIKEDAFHYLNQLEKNDFPHLIYLDPMHPQRQKSALVKKDMQALQKLIGPDEEVLALIELARTRALQKVVVKWPTKIAALLAPSSSILGKTIRFDIYSI